MGQLITVKDCISQASMEIGIAQKPITTAVGTLDQDIAQMLALLSVVADEVLLEQPYCDTLGDGIWLYANDDVIEKTLPTADDDLILFDARLAVNERRSAPAPRSGCRWAVGCTRAPDGAGA